MRLLGITDLHGHLDALRRILAAAQTVDLVLFGGDITNFGQPDDAEMLVRRAGETSHATVLAVCGNCDSAAIDDRLRGLGVGLHREGRLFDALGVQGISGIPPWRSGMYQFTEGELSEALAAGGAMIAEARRRVLLAHVPPCDGSVDRTHFFRHAGSAAVRTFIDETQPDLVVCGHVHEGRGVEQLGRTVVVNCGPANQGCFALIEIDPRTDRPPWVELRQA